VERLMHFATALERDVMVHPRAAANGAGRGQAEKSLSCLDALSLTLPVSFSVMAAGTAPSAESNQPS
jgi:hypothetical protein